MQSLLSEKAVQARKLDFVKLIEQDLGMGGDGYGSGGLRYGIVIERNTVLGCMLVGDGDGWYNNFILLKSFNQHGIRKSNGT